MSEPLQPIHYMQQRDLTPSEWWEFYQQKKTELEASVRECELEIKDLTIRAQKAEKERDKAREELKWTTQLALDMAKELKLKCKDVIHTDQVRELTDMINNSDKEAAQ